MHKLLKHQLKRDQLSEDDLDPRWQSLLDAVDRAYVQADQDRELLERSLKLSSKELISRNSELQDKLGELESIRTRLEDSLLTLNTTFDAIGEAIIAFDEKGNVVKFNELAGDMLDLNKYKSGEYPTRALSHLYRKIKDPAVLIHELRHIAQDPLRELFGVLEFNDNSVYEYHSSAKLKDDQLLGRVWCFRNVTEIKKNEALVRHQAYHDVLTDLPNRALFMDRLEHAIIYARRMNSVVAVLFIDLDQFKKVNDTCGHQIGDALLKEVTERLIGNIREHDTVARLGGDEFTVLLEGLQSHSFATSMSHRILRSLKKPFQIETHIFYISCSIGISLYPCDGSESKELVRKADIAMYYAKDTGRNNFQYFNESLERLAVHYVKVENKLRDAMANDELCLYYQPQVASDDGRIVGVEALLRWIPSDGNIIPPLEFIPIAERTGLIGPLGAWVFDQVCKQISSWRDQNITDIPVSVNLSAKELQDEKFLDRIRWSLNKYDIPGHLIVAEITETVLMEDIDHTLGVLNEIRALNISIAIDDFGTGYSSLQYLQKLPVDTLKIDKSFIIDLSKNQQNEAIVDSIISLGHNLGLSIVAEGVEDDEVSQYLIGKKCEHLQGFYFYRPLNVESVTPILLAERNQPIV